MVEIAWGAAAIAAAIAIGLLAYAATKPDTFEVQRTARIDAPPEQIFPLIASPRRMNTWNPFLEPDPNIELTYSGPDSGKGAAHDWSGNRQVGAGRVEVVDVTPPRQVTIRLDMLKPMEAHNTVVFTLQPSGRGTSVTWAMSGRQPFIGKLVTLFIDCERMVGSQFEKGLAKLKAIAEGGPHT